MSNKDDVGSGPAGETQDRKRSRIRTGGGVLLAASAVGAAAWYDIEHRHVTRAVLSESKVKIERLSDIKLDDEAMAVVERGLLAEWGKFGLLGFEKVKDLAKKAGGSIFIAFDIENERYVPRGALQTSIADIHGDPELLREKFASFQELTSEDGWKAAKHGGDTALLLQITTFETNGERNAGLGSQLRNAVLHMMSEDVKFALTMTPIDAKPGAKPIDFADPATYTPAMKFHNRGGAEPVTILKGFKPAIDDSARHGEDIVVLRYARDEDGKWAAPRPEMRLRTLGPLEEQILVAGRRLRQLSRRGRAALRARRDAQSSI